MAKSLENPYPVTTMRKSNKFQRSVKYPFLPKIPIAVILTNISIKKKEKIKCSNFSNILQRLVWQYLSIGLYKANMIQFSMMTRMTIRSNHLEENKWYSSVYYRLTLSIEVEFSKKISWPLTTECRNFIAHLQSNSYRKNQRWRSKY